jgi:CheY-like chemotaxis protein
MKRVLVVDDVPEVTALLRAKLERTQRFTVFEANKGRDALKMAADIHPDIMVCDIDMPEMDGGDLVAAMAQKEQTKKIPVIFLSSLITPEDSKHGAEAGGRPIVSKQSPIEVLIERIDDNLP